MSYEIRRFGWLPDPLDPRDLTVRHPEVATSLGQMLPKLSTGLIRGRVGAAPGGTLRVDLRPWCSEVESQGNVGSCTANAVVGAYEYFQRKTTGTWMDASRFFLYRATRRFLGWGDRGDTGAFIRSTIKTLRLFGTPPEVYWPYDEKDFDREPDAFHYAFAQNFRALKYFRLEESISQLKSALDSGLPFAFGFTCFESIRGDDAARTGVIPYPSTKEGVVGGHAVLAVGYSDSHLVVRNSWGKDWGDAGYGYLPWAYFDRERLLATDCWALVDASVLGLEEIAGQEPFADKVARAPVTQAPIGRLLPQPEPTYAPLIQVVRGVDPVQSVPLRLTSTGVAHDGDGLSVGLPRSLPPVSLTLRTLRLNQSFDFALFGSATSELYLAALVWDLSGAAPRVYPDLRELSVEQMKGAYRAKRGGEIRFVGDGLTLWPGQPVVGALYVRLLILESDKDLRELGAKMGTLVKQVRGSELTQVLEAIAKAPTAAAVAGIGMASLALMKSVSEILTANGDDLVALFDGTYGADSLLRGRNDVYEQLGATVELALEVEELQARAGRARPTALQQMLGPNGHGTPDSGDGPERREPGAPLGVSESHLAPTAHFAQGDQLRSSDSDHVDRPS